ncbi:craniofacial development protein 2-like [Anabrus simplex]|uniref:craniofacial development protein 2-like n=1 Tax=Anabrus simplex TaxID=316456 RepID=UPI0035A33CD0
MPTSLANNEEIERIYEEIEDLIQYVKGDENLIVMGDWNAVVGQGRDGSTVGKFGLVQRNERGSRLVEFCTDHNFVLVNTWFKHHKRRLYPWTRPVVTGRYQIDFIMVKQRFRNQVLNCKTFPGADVDSDHNLVMKYHLKLKTFKKGKNAKRWDLDKLKENTVRDCFKEHVAKGLNEKAEGNTIEEEWIVMRNEVRRAVEEMLGKKKRSIKNQWITQVILDFSDERRKYKNARNEEGRKEYSRLKNEVGRKCKVAKEDWLKEKCKDVQLPTIYLVEPSSVLLYQTGSAWPFLFQDDLTNARSCVVEEELVWGHFTVTTHELCLGSSPCWKWKTPSRPSMSTLLDKLSRNTPMYFY